MKQTIHALWRLLRIVPVLSWSGGAVATTALPLFRKAQLPVEATFSVFFIFLGGVFVQGFLSHAVNDLADHRSETDLHSPGLLSGGSRVIAKGLLTYEQLQRWALRFTVLSVCLLLASLLARQPVLALLLAFGIWSALSYSLPPLLLSYRPFLGECLSAFPAIFMLALAAPLFFLHHLPSWALENAGVHALFSISWLMIHHIPDRFADRDAVPRKTTTVVYFMDKYGSPKAPAYLYLLLTALSAVACLPFARPVALLGTLAVIAVSFVRIRKTNVASVHSVSRTEKQLTMLSLLNAIWLGVTI
ncbi:MAG TPA: prenyltransferase [Bacillales bacterium]|nr:prenyltransferase [Bacillales bacterium]